MQHDLQEKEKHKQRKKVQLNGEYYDKLMKYNDKKITNQGGQRIASGK